MLFCRNTRSRLGDIICESCVCLSVCAFVCSVLCVFVCVFAHVCVCVGREREGENGQKRVGKGGVISNKIVARHILRLG